MIYILFGIMVAVTYLYFYKIDGYIHPHGLQLITPTTYYSVATVLIILNLILLYTVLPISIVVV